jgi:hypothetical protein
MIMRSYFLFLLSILLLSSWAGELACQAATADALTPGGSMQMPFTIVNGTVAVWSGSAFVFVKDRFSSAPLFLFFDRNGTQVAEFMFSIPGVSHIDIYDNSVALGLDGSLAIVGTAYFDDSRGGMFVAWVSPDRQEQTIIRTSPFFPAAVTLAFDGTIWVAGHDSKPGQKERDYGQHLVRRYDKTGKLLGSFIPWSALGTDLPFASSVLLPVKDRVGWYSPRSHAYIEFSSDGSVINRFESAPHSEHDVTHVAVCDDGGLFVGDSRPNGPHQTASWGIYTLDRQRGEWSLIPRNEKWGVLFGCDGTRLATTTDFRAISWLQPTGK